MARLSQKLRILKWCGAIASAGMVILFEISMQWMVHWSTPGWQRFFGLGCGAVVYVWLPSDRDPAQYRWMDEGWSFMERAPGAASPAITRKPRMEWRLRLYQATTSHWWLVVPLWLPFLLCLVPTCYLFWHDRVPQPGHCRRCGYNLTGNTSGRCPECGLSLADPASREQSGVY